MNENVVQLSGRRAKTCLAALALRRCTFLFLVDSKACFAGQLGAKRNNASRLYSSVGKVSVSCRRRYGLNSRRLPISTFQFSGLSVERDAARKRTGPSNYNYRSFGQVSRRALSLPGVDGNSDVEEFHRKNIFRNT